MPENHRELRDFCQRVQDELKLKLYYKGESPGVLGDKFVREFLVQKREAVPKAQKDELMEKQEQRCAKCNDLLGGCWEVHHDPRVAEGGRRLLGVSYLPRRGDRKAGAQGRKGATTLRVAAQP